MRHPFSILLALLLATSMLGPARASEAEPVKVNRYTTKVVFHDVHVLVGVRLLAVRHRPYRYLPIEISVSNQGKAAVHVDVSGFHLVDDEGHPYPVASYLEVRAEHRLIQYDKSRSTAFGFADLDQTEARIVESRFYPIQGETVDPRIELLKRERIVDLVYFQDEDGRDPKSLVLTIEGLIDAPPLRIPLDVPGS